MWINNWCEFTDRLDIPWMGYSMRTDDFRYTEWAKWDGKTQRPDWTVLAGRELYDHRGDTGSTATCFDDYENSNLARVPSHQADVQRLSAQLHALVASQPYSGPL
jgi:iduronate 2-sulfatase